MKRYFFIFSVICVILLACSKEDGTGGKQDVGSTIVCMTSDATGITQTSAVLNGTASIKNAKSSNGDAYFYYSTTQGDAKTLKSSGQRVSAGKTPSSGGNFSYTLSNLTSATTYYYVSSVSIDDIEELGNVKSFTTEKKSESVSSTGAAIDITVNSATLCAYANISADVKGDIVLGIIYSTNSEPSLQNGKLLTSTDLDANNMYKVEAKDLKPQTKYYYKSILSNGNLNYYGEVKDFTTAEILASVSTFEAWDIEKDKAKVGGKVSISSKGDVTVSACVYYGTEGTSLETLKLKGAKVTAETISDDGTFSVKVSELNADTKYYYVADVLVEDIEFTGEIKSFTTADKPAESIITGEYSDLGEASVKLYGICSQEGEAGLSVVYGIEYSKTDLTTEATSVKATGKDSNNKFCCQLSGLSSNSLYYYRAYSLFNGIRSYGEVKSFTTKDFTATVTTNDATDIIADKATLNAKLSVTSIENLDTKVWFLYSNTASDLESLKSSGYSISGTLIEDGTAAARLQWLNHSTTYYYVACAQVHDKTVYGEVKTFMSYKFEVDKTSVEFEIDGGEQTITFTTSMSWSLWGYDDKVKAWLSINPASGNGSAVVTVKAMANTGYDRSATVTFHATNDPYYRFVEYVTFTQKGPKGDIWTVQEFIKAADPTTLYKLKGTVDSFNSKYCSFNLNDGTGNIYVYSVDAASKTEFGSKIKDGSTVTLQGYYTLYNNTPEIQDAKIISCENEDSSAWERAEAKTVSEFIAAAATDTYYKLTGTISDYMAANAPFTLTDASGKIKIFQVVNSSNWASKMHNGGTVTIAGKFKLYETTPEMVSGYILAYDASTEPVEGLKHPLTSGITWTLGAYSYDNTSDGVSKQSSIVNGKTVDNHLKLASSSKAGNATLTIPSGVTKIGLYVAGWEETTLTVGYKNVSVPKTNGCTGNAPYTLTLSDDVNYVEVPVSGSSVEVSCPKRMLLIGINAVK